MKPMSNENTTIDVPETVAQGTCSNVESQELSPADSENYTEIPYMCISPLYGNGGIAKWLRKGTRYYEIACEIYTNKYTDDYPKYYKTLSEACLTLLEMEKRYKSKLVFLGLLIRTKKTPIGEYDN